MESKLSSWLNAELQARGWSERELARRAGVSHTAINNALTQQYNTRLDTYRGIAKALGMPLDEVLRRAGELPERPPSVIEEEPATYIIRELSPETRRAALAMLQGLRQLEEKAADEQDRRATGSPQGPDLSQLFNAPGSRMAALSEDFDSQLAQHPRTDELPEIIQRIVDRIWHAATDEERARLVNLFADYDRALREERQTQGDCFVQSPQRE